MRRAWILPSIVALALLTGCSSSAPPAASPTTEASVAPWYPADFQPLNRSGSLAFRWLKAHELSCTYSDATCWGMIVIPRDGCGTLYVELSIVDWSDTVIGMTNDTVSGVAPGQRAKLIFDTFEERADKAKIADTSCF